MGLGLGWFGGIILRIGHEKRARHVYGCRVVLGRPTSTSLLTRRTSVFDIPA